MSSAPTGLPSTRNWTPPMPLASDAVAVRLVVPVTVAPLAGAVSETMGGVVSVRGRRRHAHLVRVGGDVAGGVVGPDRVGVGGRGGDGRVGEARPGDFADLVAVAEDPVARNALVVAACRPGEGHLRRRHGARREVARRRRRLGVGHRRNHLDRGQVPAVVGRRGVVQGHGRGGEGDGGGRALHPQRVAGRGQGTRRPWSGWRRRCAPPPGPSRCRRPRPRSRRGWCSARPRAPRSRRWPPRPHRRRPGRRR